MTKPENRRKAKKFLLFGIYFFIFAGVCFRIYSAVQYPPINHIFSDPARHLYLALNPFTNDAMSVIDPIGYQVWLSAILRITGNDPLAVAIYVALISCITPWFWYRFFRELFDDKLTALFGWLVLTWLPSWIGIFSYFMSETLFLPLLGCSLWFTWKNLRKGNSSSWFYFSLSWIFSSLTRLIALPLSIISLLFSFAKKGFQWKHLGILGILLVVFLLPVSFRSQRILGTNSPFGFPLMNEIYQKSAKKVIKFQIEGRKSWFFSSPSLHFNPFEGLFEWESQRKGVVEFSVNPHNGLKDWKLALEKNSANFNTQLQMLFENSIFLLFSESWPDNNSKHLAEKWSIHSRWIWAPLFLATMIFNFFYCVKNKKLPLLLVLNTTAWFLCMFSPSGIMEGRYRKPLEGLLIANVIFLIVKRRVEESTRFDELSLQNNK